MTRAEIRRVVNQALDHIDWLDKHASARIPKWNKQFEVVLKDLRKWMLKIIETPVHMRELKPGERDIEDPDDIILDRQSVLEESEQPQAEASDQFDQDACTHEEDD